ncbi:hypothetical protein EDD16DRAFT_1730225 [Pisolithus croceorrhizus]|nr:hypothetical protein EDD16DRAFT_1730225 [Pisolithus croceorrhizus]KAI6165477.1 hypothetical protein EDD17DRAFT_1555039 [Pisolithus thermaeus]
MTSTTTCTPPHRSTLSIKEFSHLVSESLDMSPYSSPFNLEELEKGSSEKQKPSPLQRIFRRQSPLSTSAGDHCSPEKNTEDMPATPRRMGFPWPFSRGSPGGRSSYYEPNGRDMSDEQKPPDPTGTLVVYRSDPTVSATSLVAGSTSSLGSLIPPNEQRFSPAPRDDSFDDSHRSLRESSSSPITFARPNSPARATAYIAATSSWASRSLYSNKSPSSSINSSGTEVVEIGIAISSEDYVRNGADASSPSTRSESDFSEDDPTPKATTFSSSAIAPPSSSMGEALTLTQRRRLQALSLILPPHGAQSNVTPFQQESEASSDPVPCTSITQPMSISPMQSPVPIVLTTPPSNTTPVMFYGATAGKSPSLSRLSSSQCSLNSVYSGGSRARPASRGTRSPPPSSPGPPPSRPLPAVPAPESSKPSVPQVFLSGPGVSVPVSAPMPISAQLSLFPPVPPLSPALKSRQSMLAMQLPLPNSRSSNTAVANKLQPEGQVQQAQGRSQSPSRSPSKQTQFQIQSPPGALRLPSRLSGGTPHFPDGFTPSMSASGLLPSPPASPITTKGSKRISAPGTPNAGFFVSSQSATDTLTPEPPRPLKRPTSLGAGILEAASVAAAVGNTAMVSDSVQGNVRRTKSILLLGSRSKFAFPFGSGGAGGSGASRGTATGAGMQKRVQIRAESGDGQACKDSQEDEVEADGKHCHGCVGIGIGAVMGGEKEAKEKDVSTLKSGRRRSTLGLMNISLGIGRDKDKERDRDKSRQERTNRTSDPTPGLVPPPTSPSSSLAAPQILILRERRHSAPILSRMRSRTRSRLAMNEATGHDTNTEREPSMDWTLSLPLSTDVPGDRISPLVKGVAGAAEGEGRGESEVEEEEKEDWTLCMPLRVRVEVAITPPVIEGGGEVSGVPKSNAEDGDNPSNSSTSDLDFEPKPDDVCVHEASQRLEPCAEPEEDVFLSDKHIDIREQLPTPSPSPTPSSPLLAPSPYVHVHGHGTELEYGVRARTMYDSDGGLDVDSGRGKRGSGWNVLGWFGDTVAEATEEAMEEGGGLSPNDFDSLTRRRESIYHSEPQQPTQRHLSKDSTATVASTTTETTIYYSARSSCYSRHSPLNTDFSRRI